MRVLIVNGFSEKAEGRRSFSVFKHSVIEAFSHQKMYNVSDIEFIEVDRSNIDCYLFETVSGYQSRDAEKLFDHLDFVFIDGDANMLPWLKSSRKFLVLIRMCKATKKILFACTFALQSLVYSCATNFNINRVINGKGKGGQLKEFSKSAQNTVKSLIPGDVFLDSATGDIYCWDTHKKELYPVANAGVHNHKDAQDNEVLSHTMLKTSQHWVRIYDNPDQIVIGKSSEAKCRIFKQYAQH